MRKNLAQFTVVILGKSICYEALGTIEHGVVKEQHCNNNAANNVIDTVINKTQSFNDNARGIKIYRHLEQHSQIKNNCVSYYTLVTHLQNC